jgi:hypothetical protein
VDHVDADIALKVAMLGVPKVCRLKKTAITRSVAVDGDLFEQRTVNFNSMRGQEYGSRLGWIAISQPGCAASG